MTADFQPLLAATAGSLSQIRYPVLASPKLDGIRCVVRGGRALTRKLKLVPNKFVQAWVSRNVPEGVDGELMLKGRNSFGEVSSAVMSAEGEPDFVFCAFDFLGTCDFTNLGFQHRHTHMVKVLADAGLIYATSRVAIVPQVRVETEQDLGDLVSTHQDAGFEGTMVRDPAGRYKFGRSTVKEGILLKIKPWHDEEATVVGLVEQMHNANEQVRDERGYAKRSHAKAGKVPTGKLGALQCLTEDGVGFEIGTGFTDAQRVSIWEAAADVGKQCGNPGYVPFPIGRLVKFKHLGRFPDTRVPRGPVFLGWRED